MSAVKALSLVSSLLALLIVAPIWYYLLYRILVAVHATELMWFFYWVYIPAAVFSGILSRIVDAIKPS